MNDAWGYKHARDAAQQQAHRVSNRTPRPAPRLQRHPKNVCGNGSPSVATAPEFATTRAK